MKEYVFKYHDDTTNKKYRKITTSKSNISYFKKIKYKGFTFLSKVETKNSLYFKVDNQLLRKLKLMKIEKCIETDSVEYKIINLLDMSIMRNDEPKNMWVINGFWSNKIDEEDENEDKIEIKEEQKIHLKYQYKYYNQKIKNYVNKKFN